MVFIVHLRWFLLPDFWTINRIIQIQIPPQPHSWRWSMLVSEKKVVSCPILLHLESESFLSKCSVCLWSPHLEDDFFDEQDYHGFFFVGIPDASKWQQKKQLVSPGVSPPKTSKVCTFKHPNPHVACCSSCAMASEVILALVPLRPEVPRKTLDAKRQGGGFWLPWTKVPGEFEDDFFWPSIFSSPGCFFSELPKNSSRTFWWGYFQSCQAGATSAVLYPRQSMVNHFRLDRPREV